jgi:hypothetical protein
VKPPPSASSDFFLLQAIAKSHNSPKGSRIGGEHRETPGSDRIHHNVNDFCVYLTWTVIRQVFQFWNLSIHATAFRITGASFVVSYTWIKQDPVSSLRRIMWFLRHVS